MKKSIIQRVNLGAEEKAAADKEKEIIAHVAQELPVTMKFIRDLNEACKVGNKFAQGVWVVLATGMVNGMGDKYFKSRAIMNLHKPASIMVPEGREDYAFYQLLEDAFHFWKESKEPDTIPKLVSTTSSSSSSSAEDPNQLKKARDEAAAEVDIQESIKSELYEQCKPNELNNDDEGCCRFSKKTTFLIHFIFRATEQVRRGLDGAVRFWKQDEQLKKMTEGYIKHFDELLPTFLEIKSYVDTAAFQCIRRKNVPMQPLSIREIFARLCIHRPQDFMHLLQLISAKMNLEQAEVELITSLVGGVQLPIKTGEKGQTSSAATLSSTVDEDGALLGAVGGENVGLQHTTVPPVQADLSETLPKETMEGDAAVLAYLTKKQLSINDFMIVRYGLQSARTSAEAYVKAQVKESAAAAFSPLPCPHPAARGHSSKTFSETEVHCVCGRLGGKRAEHAMQCDKCGFQSFKSCCFNKHMEESHVSCATLLKSSRRVYKCERGCGQLFLSKNQMFKHQSETNRQCASETALRNLALTTEQRLKNLVEECNLLKKTLEEMGDNNGEKFSSVCFQEDSCAKKK